MEELKTPDFIECYSLGSLQQQSSTEWLIDVILVEEHMKWTKGIIGDYFNSYIIVTLW
jgi:hypothetical protein